MANKVLVVILENDDVGRIIRGLNFALKSKRLGILEEVEVLFWRRSEELVLSGDPEISTLVEALKHEGVRLWACMSVAKEKGIKEELESMGIIVESATKVVNEHIRDGFETAWF